MTVSGRWGLILVIWLVGLAAAAQYGKVSVVFDLLPDLYPDHADRMGWAVSVVGFVGLVFGVAAGALVSSFGYRRCLVVALWLGAAMSAIQALAPGFGVFLITRFVEGVSHLGLVVAAPTLIAQISLDRHRGAALSLWSTFFGVSFALLAWFGRPLAIDHGVDALFAAHAVIMGIMALGLGWALRAVTMPARLPMPNLTALAAQHLDIYRSSRRISPAAGWLFYTSCFLAILTVLPPFIDEDSRAAVLTAMPLVSIAVSMTLGVGLLRVMPAVGVVMLGFGLSALVMVWLFVVPGDPLACLVLAGCMGLIQGASFAAVPQINDTPAHQAEANGAMSQAGNLGNTIGTPLMLAAIGGAGYAGLVTFAAVLFLAGLLSHLVLAQARRNG